MVNLATPRSDARQGLGDGRVDASGAVGVDQPVRGWLMAERRSLKLEY